jgi:hypothetical protein
MKAIITSSKLFRFLVIFIPLFLILLTFHIYWNPENRMKLEIECKKINQTQDYCSFNCSVRSNMPSFGRIVVTHTVWASIFEEKIQLNNEQDIIIMLPRRNFVYYIRGAFYNNSNYGIYDGELEC